MKLLFVCTGNTCRSPMAEAILKDKGLSNIEVRSVGLQASQGVEMSANAQQVLNEEGILHNHRANQITYDVLEWADVILTMTTSHRDSIALYEPDFAHKTFTLKEYVNSDGSWDVFDPYGGDIALYKETFKELKALIDTLIIKVEGA